MLRNLTYRQKLKYLGIGAVLLLLVCYKFSFAKTISEYKTHTAFQTASAGSANDETALHLLQSKNRMLDEIMKKFVLDTADQSKNLLNIAGNFCNNNELQLKEYKPFPAIQVDSIKTVTRSITVQGGFTNCLRLLYLLETQANAGRIGSVYFKSITAPGNSGTELTCTVYIQNLILSKNETE